MLHYPTYQESKPVLMDENATKLKAIRLRVFIKFWPGIARTIWVIKDKETYFLTFKKYFQDGAM
jgi:hypothetical protein